MGRFTVLVGHFIRLWATCSPATVTLLELKIYWPLLHLEFLPLR